MCGICGQYNFRNNRDVLAENIKKMTETIIHRGPDDYGYYISGQIGLGFRRLSIIDLQSGHQPMSNEDESVWIVFNGEIYNFKELRKELKGLGHVFKSTSDTEVIIHGYEQWGVDVLNHLNGMFGLAIWDSKKRRLLIARDPMGIKLLYYKIVSGCIYFGSEIRTINAVLKERAEVDPISMNLFLRYRYTPSPLTIYKGIKKLAPGTMLIIENGSFHLKRWYNFKPSPFSPMKADKEAKEELLSLYKESVKRHLISDVPVGLLLSGGIDSGLLLGLMSLCGNSWPTYTIGYGTGYKEDELVDAKNSAQLFSAQNISIKLEKHDFEDSLSKITSYLEEPVASSSIVPMYHLCERARQNVKVVLMGQGPDELFGGYVRHLGVHYGRYWRKTPKYVRSPLAKMINYMPRNESLKRGVYSLGVPNRMDRYRSVFSLIQDESINNLFKDDLLTYDANIELMKSWEDFENLMEDIDELGGLQLIEVRSSLPDELLMYADKLSMAHGLEVRVPYLDRNVVEYIERLGSHFKIRYGSRKWLHRKVCFDFLPSPILRRKKKGFAVNVVDDWFRDSLINRMDNYLLDDKSLIYRYLRHNKVCQLIREHQCGGNDNHKILFSLVVLEEWLRLI